MQKLVLLFISFLTTTLWSQKDHIALQKTENKILSHISTSKKWAPIDFDSALFYADKAIFLADKNHEESLLADAFTAKGLAFDYQSKLDSTLFWYEKALAIRIRQKNKVALVKLYNNFGVSYYYQGMYDRALTYYIESLKQSESIGDSIGIARSFNNMGLIYDKKGDWIKATEYYEKSLHIKRLLKDNAGLLFPLSNLSNIAFLQKDYSSAERYMSTNLEVSIQLKDSMQIGISHGLLALIYATQGNEKKTQEHVGLTEKYIPWVHDAFESSLLYYNLGESLRLTGPFHKSEVYLLKSIGISKKIKQTDVLLKGYESLRQLYRKQGDLTESLVYYDLYTALNDSIYKVNQAVEIAKIEQQYQWEKKEQEIELLQVHIEHATAQKRNWILGFGFLGILGAVVTGFLIINKRKSDELEVKNAQIETALAENKTLMKEMNHRIKNNLQMIASMLHLQTHYANQPEIAATLHETASRIKSISLIHQKLYAKDGMQQIQIEPYIREIAQSILDHFDNTKKAVLKFDLTPIDMEIEKAQSVGLIVNELLSNALKHAISNEERLIIQIELKKNETFKTLIVKDNGSVEKLKNVDLKQTYGMQLIQSFVEKLDGKMQIFKENGWEVQIKWT